MTRSPTACALAFGILMFAPLKAVGQAVAVPTTPAPEPSAEQWFRPGTWMFTAELGGAAFSDFQSGEAQSTSVPPALGEFERRISARTSVSIGGRVSYWIGRSWGLRAAGAFVPTRFSVWNEDSAQRMLDSESVDGEEEVPASLGVWLADVALVFRFPHSFGRVVPYGLAGGGVVHYRPGPEEDLPPEARRRFADGPRTSPAALFGVGAVIPLERHELLLSFELTNHLAGTPLDDEGAGESFEISGVPVELSPAGSAGSDGVGLTSNLRLSLGLTLPLRH